jgi:ketol-acid reductoisomerase
MDGIHDPMVKSLEEITSGLFSEEWVREQEMGYPNFKKLLDQALSSRIQRDSEYLRGRLKVPYDIL